MKSMTRSLFALCITIGVCPGDAWADQFVHVRPKFEPGAESFYRHTFAFRQFAMRTETERGRSSMMEGMIGYKLRVLEDQKDDHHPLEMTIVCASHRLDPARMAYDSRVAPAPNDPQTPIVNAVLNHPFRVVVRDDGTIASVEGMEAFLEQRFEGSSRLQFVADYYRKLISPRTLAQVLLFDTLKDAPPACYREDDWDARYEADQVGGRIVRDLTYTLDTVKLVGQRPIAFISAEGTFSLGKPPESRPANEPRILSVNGDEKAEIEVNVITQTFERVRIDQKLLLKIEWRDESTNAALVHFARQLTGLELERTTLEALLAPPEDRKRPPTPPTTQPASAPAEKETPKAVIPDSE